MRKNLSEAYAAWQERRPCRPAVSCWTDGQTLYSYDTAILTRAGDGRIILNRTKYSATTSQQQAALSYALPTFREVYGIRRNANGFDLEAAVQ